jgi:hypothetical protein
LSIYSDTGTEGTKVASGTTAQRGSTTGQLRFNTTTGLAEYYTGTAFKSIDAPPTIVSQITAVAPKASFLNAQEPYGVKVENTSGLSAHLLVKLMLIHHQVGVQQVVILVVLKKVLQ